MNTAAIAVFSLSVWHFDPTL